MWDWVSNVASTAWSWAKDNASTIYDASKGFIEDRISIDEKAALLKSQQMAPQRAPSLGQYGTSATRSNAGVSSYADIKEASGTKYAQFLYYTSSYLKTKAKYENAVPNITYKKSGLGAKS
jgi:hypothetical protein